MNFKLFLVLIFISGCHSSPEKIVDFPIRWEKDFKLSWKNYKGIAPANPLHDCRSYVRLYSSKTEEGDTSIFEVKAFFTEDSAFCVKGKESDYLLNHEQKHFDLTEVYARMLRKYLTDFSGNGELDAYYFAGRDSIRNMGWKDQEQYDLITNHGLIVPMQKEWNEYIANLLNFYGKYENPIVKIKRPPVL